MAKLSDYAEQLKNLLPRGNAWNKEDGSTFSEVMYAFALEFFNIDERVGDLLRESDPSRATEMLPDWERALGLPAPCLPAPGTLAERRAAVVAKLNILGGQSREFFIALAATMGYTISIAEFQPCRIGMPIGSPMTNGLWRHTWQVNAPTTTVKKLPIGGSIGEPLAKWGYEDLECAFERLKPAHTRIIFSYTE